jgi:hypothetical protein
VSSKEGGQERDQDHRMSGGKKEQHDTHSNYAEMKKAPWPAMRTSSTTVSRGQTRLRVNLFSFISPTSRGRSENKMHVLHSQSAAFNNTQTSLA